MRKQAHMKMQSYEQYLWDDERLFFLLDSNDMGKEYWDLDVNRWPIPQDTDFLPSFFGGKNKPTHQNLIHYQRRPNH